ncbi:MAG: hypothetical protein ACR2N0_12445 [Rubrobacteraceae bacterium]
MTATSKLKAFGISNSIIDPGLRGDGLRWLEREFGGYDFSRVERFALRDGSTSKKKPPGVWGACSYPRRGERRYKITCSVKQPLPARIFTRQRPLYRNEDGTFPSTPRGMRRGQLFVSGRGASERAWYRLYAATSLKDAGEAVVWIVSHEMYHYLRSTRQVEGTNNEIEADAFSDALLRSYRHSVGEE